MPPGAPYSGRIPPYPSICVDKFLSPRSDANETPIHLYLLTHTHSDHIDGLDALSFGQVVRCTPDSKRMLLNCERAADRVAFDKKEIARRVLPWGHLLHSYGSLNRDLLQPIPLNEPQVFQLDGTDSVTVTAIDANHCPGAVMYLIEGSKGAVLHTGDMRAETSHLESLKCNPFLGRYLTPCQDKGNSILEENTDKIDRPKLEAIYLDTACLLSTVDIPSKMAATDGLVGLMAMYPLSTRFFLNTWTYGYEDIIKAVARSFNTKVHVDRYKKAIYGVLSDPVLDAFTTTDSSATRFHACERTNRCECVPFNDPDVVYVNPVECPSSTWDIWKERVRQRLLNREKINYLIVPLARHSTLPELKQFVSLFRPKRVVPNTVLPGLNGADWACMSAVFRPYIASGGELRILEDMRANGYDSWTTALDAKRGTVLGILPLNWDPSWLRMHIPTSTRDNFERGSGGGGMDVIMELIPGFIGDSKVPDSDRYQTHLTELIEKPLPRQDATCDDTDISGLTPLPKSGILSTDRATDLAVLARTSHHSTSLSSQSAESSRMYDEGIRLTPQGSCLLGSSTELSKNSLAHHLRTTLETPPSRSYVKIAETAVLHGKLSYGAGRIEVLQDFPAPGLTAQGGVSLACPHPLSYSPCGTKETGLGKLSTSPMIARNEAVGSKTSHSATSKVHGQRGVKRRRNACTAVLTDLLASPQSRGRSASVSKSLPAEFARAIKLPHPAKTLPLPTRFEAVFSSSQGNDTWLSPSAMLSQGILRNPSRASVRSSDPEKLATQRRQRNDLLALVKRFQHTKSAIAPVTANNIDESSLKELKIVPDPLLSRHSGAVRSLPLSDKSAGSMDTLLMNRLKKQIQDGGMIDLKCLY